MVYHKDSNIPSTSTSSEIATQEINVSTNEKRVYQSTNELGEDNAGYIDDINLKDLELGEDGLKHGLKSRHVQLIALGGTIGTGLFIGSGGTLSKCGPAGLLTGYLILATVIYFIMNQLGVMVTYLPQHGSISELARRYVDPSLGFATAAIYVYTFLILVCSEISAAAIIIEYWTDKVPVGVWIVIMLALIIVLNFSAVKYYGESEFWFASLKILLIVGLIIVGIVIFFGGGPNQTHVLGFHYWKHPGPFKEHLSHGNTGRFLDCWTAIIKSGFAFIVGPELVAITAAETQNPRRNVAKASRRFIWRLMFFYCVGALIIGIIVGSDNPHLLNGSSDASASPFVIGIQNVGIKGLNHVINAVVLTSALSAGNSFFYAGTRYLLTMAEQGQAPKIFKKVNSWGVPYYCCLFCALISCLSFLNVNSASADVFNWFSNMCTISGFIGWMIVGISYLRFEKAIRLNGLYDRLPYKPIWAPYTVYYSVGFIFILTLTNGYAVFFDFKASDFIAAYITLPFFFVFYFGHKIYTRNWNWCYAIEEIDVLSGLDDAEREEVAWNEKWVPPTSLWGRFMDWFL
ncbi:hypothetical protein WICPIJ_002932 [Wickerhamomyces pijperi]|uniref:Amino acid permease/ SLC12A domain-containing protein n=1 Tax=Wickerhamomyces pijperi TaxID=599730 RepID=A0A9P8QAS9_WICPI|nr:hypothetical protein WICPIJ_002932 [Wickerhamomyces pijperi]